MKVAAALVLILAATQSSGQDVGMQENEDFADLDEFEEGTEMMTDPDPSAPISAGSDVGLDTEGNPIKVVFEHCPSAKTTKLYGEYQARLERIYPGASISGAPSPSTSTQETAIMGLAVLQFALMAYFWTGRRIHGALGIPVPSWYSFIEQSPLAPLMLTYYLTNMIRDRIITSGAFDVDVNEKSVWSLSQNGRPPTWQELLWNLEEAGLPRVDGADDEANWPAGWNQVKQTDTGIMGTIFGSPSTPP